MRGGWLLLGAVFALAACTGDPAKPTRVYRIGDAQLGCEAIETESRELMSALGVTEADRTRLDNQNLGLFIAGVLVALPLLAMDVTGAREVEWRAYRSRLERLEELARERGC